MVDFYDVYVQNPSIIKQEDLNFMINSTKDFISQCKKHKIDYKAILFNTVGNRRKVDEILKFYGVE